MTKLSNGELIFKDWLEEWGVPYYREVPFSPSHRYRFDFVALNSELSPALAIEIDGGPFPKGLYGHASFKKYMQDKVRDNIAAYLGWSKIIRIPSIWIYQHDRTGPMWMSKDQIRQIVIGCCDSA